MVPFNNKCTHQSVVRAAWLVLCLIPLIAFGNIVARNRMIENAGRMQQGRLDDLCGAWRAAQQQVSVANQMLAASAMNETTAMGAESKGMAARDVASKKREFDRTEHAAKQLEVRVSAQVASYSPPKNNGLQTALIALLAMMVTASVLLLSNRRRWPTTMLQENRTGI